MRWRVGIGGERRLAGAGQAEEDRGVAARPHVGRAVHREHALRRQQVVERGEDRLLHLARVPGPADEHQLLGEVEDDERPAAGPVAGRVGLEVGRVQHGKAGAELGQLGRHGTDEHVADEQGVPRVGRDEPHGHPVRRVRAAEEILDEQLPGIQIGPHVLVQPLERGGVEPGVLFPPDPVGAAGLLDQELVLGRPAAMGRRHRGKGAGVGQGSFAALQGVLDQGGRGEIGVDPDGEEALIHEGEALPLHDCGLGHTLPCAFSASEGRPARPGGPSTERKDRREGPQVQPDALVRG